MQTRGETNVKRKNRKWEVNHCTQVKKMMHRTEWKRRRMNIEVVKKGRNAKERGN